MTLSQLLGYLYLAGVSYRGDGEAGLAWYIPAALPPAVVRAIVEHWQALRDVAAARADGIVWGMQAVTRYGDLPC